MRKKNLPSHNPAPRLPMCADCTEPSLIRILRTDGWANVCVDCYTRHFYNGKLPPKINEWKGPSPYGTQVLKEIRAKLATFGKRPPNKDWAFKILERHARGERISSYALDCAKEVAATVRPRREPGED